MDFYSKHGIADFEVKRRIAEMHSMARHVEPDEEDPDERRQAADRYFEWFAERLQVLAQRPRLGQM